MLTYTELKRNRRKCVAMTGLTPKEFNLLLPAFARAYAEQYPAEKTIEENGARSLREQFILALLPWSSSLAVKNLEEAALVAHTLSRKKLETWGRCNILHLPGGENESWTTGDDKSSSAGLSQFHREGDGQPCFHSPIATKKFWNRPRN